LLPRDAPVPHDAAGARAADARGAARRADHGRDGRQGGGAVRQLGGGREVLLLRVPLRSRSGGRALRPARAARSAVATHPGVAGVVMADLITKEQLLESMRGSRDRLLEAAATVPEEQWSDG